MVARVPAILEEMQADMYAAAKARLSTCTDTVYNWDDFMAALNNRHMALAPW